MTVDQPSKSWKELVSITDAMLQENVDPEQLCLSWSSDVSKEAAWTAIKNALFRMFVTDPEKSDRVLLMLQSAASLEDVADSLMAEEGWSVEDVLAFIVSRCFPGFIVTKSDSNGDGSASLRERLEKRNEQQTVAAFYLLRFFDFV